MVFHPCLMDDFSLTHTMESLSVPRLLLNSGYDMPVLGYGTGGSAIDIPHERLREVCLDAIGCGYVHFDTAALYGTEKPLGEAIAQALQQGTVKSRDQFFVTSKLWCADAAPDLVIPAIKQSLKNLGLQYLDLYLMHFPLKIKKDAAYPLKKDDYLPFDLTSTWAAMEECQRLGLTKSIGVSNFTCKKLSDLLFHATIPPAVNQVEMNPAWDQRKLRSFCNEKGIHVTAFSPLGANGSMWGSDAVMQSSVLKDVAESKGKSIAQISLRWIFEQGASMVVMSSNRERMRENLRIFDWELNGEDKEKIGKIPQKRGFQGDIFLYPNGPFKTLEEVWDGEVYNYFIKLQIIDNNMVALIYKPVRDAKILNNNNVESVLVIDKKTVYVFMLIQHFKVWLHVP